MCIGEGNGVMTTMGVAAGTGVSEGLAPGVRDGSAVSPSDIWERSRIARMDTIQIHIIRAADVFISSITRF